MLKILLIIVAFILIGFLIINDTYDFSVRALGYEYSFSVGLLIAGIIVLFYILHLLKKPFEWVKNYQVRRFQKNILRKENFLTLVLTTVLDQNTASIKTITDKAKSLFPKNSTEQLLFDALFHPNEHIFEQMKNNKATELAGIRGLFLSAKKNGDIDTQTRLLETALATYPAVTWLHQEQLALQLLQNDWVGAFISVEKLYKQRALSAERYSTVKACILYGLKQYKEAFKLAPDNPAFALAYAAACPKKARDILKKAWEVQPAWEMYENYYALIQQESSADQMKSIQKFVAKNQEAKLSLLAVADVAMKNHLWGVAKETLEQAINAFPLTRRMALMMAELERAGWHHEAASAEWEERAAHADTTPNWVCSACRHGFDKWDNKCPVCNTCGGLTYKS
ncbi:MAG: hypothetical protein ACI4QM_04790 [Alphaproteobacteria bacterium]